MKNEVELLLYIKSSRYTDINMISWLIGVVITQSI